jgi:PAS domain S-box-containing protein
MPMGAGLFHTVAPSRLTTTEHIPGSLILERMNNLNTFFTISNDLFCILKKDGYFKKVNPAFEKLLGYSEKELFSKPFFSYIHPDDAEMTQKEYEAVSRGKENSVIVNRFYKKSGDYCWLSWSSIVSDKNGCIYAASQDVTENKRLEEQLKKEQGEHQNEITAAVIRAEERERKLISRELHDNINQVLTTVKLYNELCLSGNGDTKQLLEKSIYYLNTSITEIRNLSKQLSTPVVGDIDLKDSVEELVSSIGATDQVNVSLDTAGIETLLLPEDLFLSIYRILQELLTNVLKHSGAKKVAIRFENKGESLIMTVTDDGKGFDPKQKAKGSGIKNMIARTESQKGTLELITSPGAGCTYRASFPLV